jgi:RNA polymerase sigma-70 factor (ECF subfamily)
MTTAIRQEKDNEIFRQEVGDLYEKHAPMLLRAAISIIGDHGYAEDAVQNVFVKLLDRPPSIEFDKNPPGYLYRAVINESLSFLEFRKRQSLVGDDINDLELAVCVEEEMTQQLEDMDQRLAVARSKLDPHLAVLLTLRYEGNYSCEEIAKLLRRSRVGVFKTIKRAERLLQKMLAPGEKQ